MTPEELADLAHLRRARDLMDRDYAQFGSPFTEIVGEAGGRDCALRDPSGNLVRIAQA